MKNFKTKTLSTIVLFVFSLLFIASSGPTKLFKIVDTYEDVKQKEAEQLIVSYDLPVIIPSTQTEQTQTKGGVTITCEVVPYELFIDDIVSENVFFADPTKPGYDIFEISHTPKPVASPQDFILNIKIKNNQDRILKVRETALLLQIDGTTIHIPEASLSNWYAGMIIKNGEFNYKIKVPEFDNLLKAKLVYLFINDVPISMDEGGNIKKRENFEWFFECSKQTVQKEAKKTFSYETRLIESKQCDRCNGTGVDPKSYQCPSCKGKGTVISIFTGKPITCSTCSGSGVVHYKCPICNGKGLLTFPKSKLPKVTNRISWSGLYVTVKTIPNGARVKVIDPETGEYRLEDFQSPCTIPWYKTYDKPSPIVVSLNGHQINVSPLSNGKELKEIIVDFTSGKPTVIKGTLVL